MRCEVQEDDSVQVELRCTDCMTRAAGAVHARGDGGARPLRGGVPRARSSRPTSARCPRAWRRSPRCSCRRWSWTSSGADDFAPPPRVRRVRLAARDRGQDRQLVAVGDGRVEPVEEADVLAADVDVDEAAQAAAVVGRAGRAARRARRRAPRAPRPPCRRRPTVEAAPPAASRSCVGSLTVTAIRPSPRPARTRRRTRRSTARSRSPRTCRATVSSVFRPSPVM